MKKIAYIELDTHAEIALNFMELMHDSEKFSVDYYFSDKVLKQLGLKETHNLKKATPENINHQLSIINYELVIIGTVHRYFHTFEKIVERFNAAVICHNLNFVKASKWNLLKSLLKEDCPYRLKLLLKEGLLKKSKVYQKAKHLLVLDQALAKEGLKNLPVLFTQFFTQPRNEFYTMVIPGAVSQRRRDYKRVLKSVGLFKFPLELIFLGKAQGKELDALKGFESQHPENVFIKYFTEKVLQKEFDENMQKADVLWCPIQQETEFFSQKEIYGKTKMSGNIGDAIKYGKWAIFPENYPSKYDFIISENQEFLKFDFNHKKTNFSEFAQEKVLQKLEKTLTELL